MNLIFLFLSLLFLCNSCLPEPVYLDSYAEKLDTAMTFDDVTELIPEKYLCPEFMGRGNGKPYTASHILNPECPLIYRNLVYIQHGGGIHLLEIYFDKEDTIVGYRLDCEHAPKKVIYRLEQAPEAIVISDGV